jgi:hypothetical protein
MTYGVGAPEMARLDGYIARVTGSLRDHRSRASFAVYAFGLLTDGERKSMEPIGARMCECPDDAREMQHTHDRMINLIRRSEWQDEPVRAEEHRHGARRQRGVNERPKSRLLGGLRQRGVNELAWVCEVHFVSV